MPIFETFAKRKHAANRSGQPDIYVYDKLPSFLRKQLAIIFRECIGHYSNSEYEPNANGVWISINNIMSREHESFHDWYVKSGYTFNSKDKCISYLLEHDDVDEVLSMVELVCRYFAGRSSNEFPRERGATRKAADGLGEINERFREHSVGYEFTNGSLFRIDSQFTHAEIVKPALALLRMKGFEEANDDFMLAHKHYREGKAKDSIVSANRAFESALKAVCKLMDWKFSPGDNARELIAVTRRGGLFPNYLEKGVDTFIATMKTGLPDVRNNAGGHGSVPETPPVPSYIARYAIDLAATNIVLIVSAYKELMKT